MHVGEYYLIVAWTFSASKYFLGPTLIIQKVCEKSTKAFCVKLLALALLAKT